MSSNTTGGSTCPPELTEITLAGAPARSWSSKPVVSWKWPRWLAAKWSSNPSAVRVSGLPITPALRTSIWRASWLARHCRTNACTLAGSVSSSAPTSTVASGCASRIEPATVAALATSRAASVTAHPLDASARAVSAPSPPDAPVTTAVVPVRSMPASTSSVVLDAPKRRGSVTRARVGDLPRREHVLGVAFLVDDPLAHSADGFDRVLRHRDRDVGCVTERRQALRAEQRQNVTQLALQRLGIDPDRLCVRVHGVGDLLDTVDRHKIRDPSRQHRRVVDGLVDLGHDDRAFALLATDDAIPVVEQTGCLDVLEEVAVHGLRLGADRRRQLHHRLIDELPEPVNASKPLGVRAGEHVDDAGAGTPLLIRGPDVTGHTRRHVAQGVVAVERLGPDDRRTALGVERDQLEPWLDVPRHVLDRGQAAPRHDLLDVLRPVQRVLHGDVASLPVPDNEVTRDRVVGCHVSQGSGDGHGGERVVRRRLDDRVATGEHAAQHRHRGHEPAVNGGGGGRPGHEGTAAGLAAAAAAPREPPP